MKTYMHKQLKVSDGEIIDTRAGLTIEDVIRSTIADIRPNCHDCGIPYGGEAWIEAVIPNRFWELINPTEYKGGGILCINCMAKRLAALNLSVQVPMKIVSGPFMVVPDDDVDYLTGTIRNIQELIDSIKTR